MATTTTVNSIPKLNKLLASLSKEASDELRAAARVIADGIADEARGRAKRLGSTAAHVAPSIRSRRDRVPKISLGGKGDMAAAFGAEYGGRRRRTTPQGGSTMQFQPWRGSSTGAGYFLWPTIRDRNEWIRDTYSQALLDALRGMH
jgi:hypothetical protein